MGKNANVIFPEVDQDFLPLYQEVLNALEKKFDSEDVRDLQNKSEKEIYRLMRDAVLPIVKIIKSGADADCIIQKLKTLWENEAFWNLYRKEVDAYLEPFRQTGFIRDMDAEEQIAYFKEIYENQFLVVDDVNIVINRLNPDMTVEKVDIGVRVLNTSERFIIANRYSRNEFQKKMKDLVRFDDDVIYYIWDLFNRNRTEHIFSFIIKNLKTE